MTLKDQLLQEIEQTPDALLEEVLDFLLFVKTRRNADAKPNVSPTNELAWAALDYATENHRQLDKPIWEVFEEFAQSIPDEVLDKLPTDGAAQHDHYLYGTPKRPE